MKTKISDLSQELIEEILSRVPLTSLSAVRCASKPWNGLSKDLVGCKAEAKHQFLGFLMIDSRVCSVRFDLQNDEFPDLSIKQIGKLDQFNVRKMFHCEGLVLCVTQDNSRIMVWNPYLGQIRLIELRIVNVNYLTNYALGYDSSRRHKILRFTTEYTKIVYEIYDFDSDLWRVIDVTRVWYADSYSHAISLKGNTYWIAQHHRIGEPDWREEDEFVDDFLCCFDFTRERFGPRLKVPFQYDDYIAYRSLACLREEQLAMMFQIESFDPTEIWVTTKIEPEVVSWSKFFVLHKTSIKGIKYTTDQGSFFIDEEKKVAVFFNITRPRDDEIPWCNIAYMIKEGGYQMEMNLGNSSNYIDPIVCSYVPSLVQIN